MAGCLIQGKPAFLPPSTLEPQYSYFLLTNMETVARLGAGYHTADLTLGQIEGSLQVSRLSSSIGHRSDTNCHTLKMLIQGQTVQASYFSILAYNVTMCLIKLCLIVQYLRIFVGHWTRLACWLTVGFTIAFSLSTFIADVFTCRPVSGFWDLTNTKAQCIDRHALWFAHAAMSIITDFAVLLIPMPALWTLKLAFRDKVATIALLSCGSFGCIMSVVRLYELWWVTYLSTDAIYDEDRNIWSIIELTTFIICASVTGLKPFFERTLQPLFDRWSILRWNSASSSARPSSWGQAGQQLQDGEGERNRLDTLHFSRSRKGIMNPGYVTGSVHRDTGLGHVKDEDLRRLASHSTGCEQSQEDVPKGCGLQRLSSDLDNSSQRGEIHAQ